MDNKHIVDITKKVERVPAYVQIGGKLLEVKKGKNTVEKAFNILQNSKDKMEGFEAFIKMTLTDKAYKELVKLDIDIDLYENVFYGIVAAMSNETFEVIEARFQEAIKQAETEVEKPAEVELQPEPAE